MTDFVCTVCRADTLTDFLTVEGVGYLRCQMCLATLMHPKHRLLPTEEAARYALHENDMDDARYRAFLMNFAKPYLALFATPVRMLDYGCGPAPLLAAILREAGHDAVFFDPYFADVPARLDDCYDGITCTETLEHFYEPAQEFDRLNTMLQAGGVLGVMTCFQTDDEAFARWHYRRDPTHVSFYRRETLAHIAAQRGWEFLSPQKDVAFFRKPK